MAEENTAVEPAEIEAKALEMGWTPKDQWKGDESRWVDAETYVERAETFVPFLQKQKKELEKTTRTLTTQVQTLTAELRAQAAAVQAIEESQAADLAEQLKATKAEIGRQLKEAKEAGDTEREVELIDQLTDVKAAEKDAAVAAKEKKEAPAPKQTTEVPLSPAYLAWREDNPWVDSDPKRARRAMLIAQEIAEEHEGKLTGKPFFDKLDQELAKLNGTARSRPSDSKVEGGRPSGGTGGGKGFADLPADAKEACRRLAPKVVGENRAHKDMASWQKAYAEKYFEQE